MAPLSLSVLLLPLAVSGFSIPHVSNKQPNYTLKKVTHKAFQKPSADVKVDTYTTMSKSASMQSRSSMMLDQVRKSKNKKSKWNPLHLITRQNAALTPASGGAEYLVDITFGTQDVKAILDTGSSDTWLIQSGFQCTDANSQAVNESQCAFGPVYNGGFAEQIPNANFKISYGDGEFVTGNMGYQDVTIGGIKVPHQEVALGTSAYWNGDNVSTGLVGLAYNAITSAFSGTDPNADGSTNKLPYDPLFTTMYKDNLSSPSFSLALQRGSGGYIAFGGLPPVSVDTTAFATAPIQVLTSQSGTSGYTFYTITPDAVVFKGSAAKQTSQYIVDSGTTLFYAPTATAKALNSLFSPKATLSGGTYTVACNAKVPALSIKIGGTSFAINGTDLILQDPSGTCVSGIQDGGSGPYILGDVFLNNVVAVFDVGAAQMRFAQHTY